MVHDILQCDGLDDLYSTYGDIAFVFYKVKFIKDFGCFKKDEEFEAVTVSFTQQEIKAYDKQTYDKFEVEGLIKSCRFSYTAWS